MEQPSWIGQTLSGRYKIEALLGQGGMSAVYKATDPNLKRVVAVKLIHSHLSSDSTFILRFESEASAVASLRHSNIVQVYDFNNDNGVYYMILEFVPGETLQDRMKRLISENRNLPLEDILNFTINISDAVGYAHQRGMVHRDIKPANIMLDPQGQAILMDFGIVKILGENHTSTGAVVGTARYMSPEIIRGEVADHRSDIYSLGITLYEMLSGRPPFISDSAMTLMMMHLNDPVPDVRSFRSDVYPYIVEILERCLAKEPEDRYQSAAELSADLRHASAYNGGESSAYIPLRPEPRTVVARHSGSKVVDPTRDTLAPTGAKFSTPLPETPNLSPAYPSPVKVSAPYKMLGVFGTGFAAIACLAALFFLGRVLFEAVPSKQARESTPTAELAVVPIVTDYSLFSGTPGGPYVIITAISLDNFTYVVDYEVHNFTENPPLHVHMFFDTVPPGQAGSPGSGPWKMTWGEYGDSPFKGYKIANRPRNASQMCALVANGNHSVILGSGNCVDLP